MPTPKLSVLEDLVRQVRNLVIVTTSVVERYARSFEELDFIRLMLEEQRETIRDHFEEVGRQTDKMLDRMERIERLEILDRTGNITSREAQRIKEDVASEAHQRALRRELAQQTKNLDNARNRAAKYGVLDVPTRIINEIESYEERIVVLKQELEDV